MTQIVPSFPADIPAAFFVVVHIPNDAESKLPIILQRAGVLQARHPKNNEVMKRGNIYVAPPDHHLTLEGGTIHVRKGPRENRHRPAIDPLFRTAARAFGANTIAVLLSGNLDDGSGGLLAVRTRRGIGIVQDPADAVAGEMPQRAKDYAGADYVLPLKAIGPKIVELSNSRDIGMKGTKKSSKKKKTGGYDQEVRGNEEVFDSDQGSGTPSVFACPECHGVLWEVKEGRLSRFRCRVGHSYAPASLKSEMDQSSERALWAAMRALEEKAAMGKRLLKNTNGHVSQRMKEQTEADIANAQEIRKMIFAAD